MATNRFAT